MYSFPQYRQVDKMAVSETSLPYHEPGITTILVLSSFLLLSNVVNWALDRLVYCGLIGQILLGIAWGTPGGKLLSGVESELLVTIGEEVTVGLLPIGVVGEVRIGVLGELATGVVGELIRIVDSGVVRGVSGPTIGGVG